MVHFVPEVVIMTSDLQYGIVRCMCHGESVNSIWTTCKFEVKFELLSKGQALDKQSLMSTIMAGLMKQFKPKKEIHNISHQYMTS